MIELSRQDLLPFAPTITEEQAQPLIAGTLARAALKAPCILDDDFAYEDAARDILTAVVLRRFKATGGAVTKATVGGVSVDYGAPLVDGLFTGSELAELQQMCAGDAAVTAPVADYCFPCARDWPDPVERRWFVDPRLL